MHTSADISPPTSSTKIWLLAAPVAALAARAVWTPLDDEDPTAYLAEVARHPDRSDVGAFLMMLSALLLIPAAFALASTLRDAKPRLARVAVAMITVGAVGMAVLSSVGLFAGYLARQPDQPTMRTVWDGFFTDAKAEFIFLAVLVGVIGFVVLAVGLYRSRRVPRAAAVLVGVGGATTLFTTGGPVRVLLLVAAGIALAGFAWVSATLASRAVQSSGSASHH